MLLWGAGVATPLTLNPTEMQANILQVLKPSQRPARLTGHKAKTKGHSQMTGRAVESWIVRAGRVHPFFFAG